MAIDNAFFETWRPRALAVLRVVTAYLFIQHGTAKLFGAPHQPMFDGLQLMSLIGLAGILFFRGRAHAEMLRREGGTEFDRSGFST